VKGIKPWIFKIQNSRNAEKPSRKQIEAKIIRGNYNRQSPRCPFFNRVTWAWRTRLEIPINVFSFFLGCKEKLSLLSLIMTLLFPFLVILRRDVCAQGQTVLHR